MQIRGVIPMSTVCIYCRKDRRRRREEGLSTVVVSKKNWI